MIAERRMNVLTTKHTIAVYITNTHRQYLVEFESFENTEERLRRALKKVAGLDDHCPVTCPDHHARRLRGSAVRDVA